jgi:hypothetical protein
MNRALTVLVIAVFLPAVVWGYGAASGSGGNAAETRRPENPPRAEMRGAYFEAIRAYREYLLNRRTCGSNFYDGITEEYYYIRMRISDHVAFGEPGSAFALVDMDDDGIPELHVNASMYNAFSYKDGDIVAQYGLSADTVLLDNRAFYTRDWAFGNRFEYIEFDPFDYSNRFVFNYPKEYRSGGYYEVRDGDFWTTKYVHPSDKEEYERVTGSYTEFAKNDDMMPWTDYAEWSRSHEDEYDFREGSPNG